MARFTFFVDATTCKGIVVNAETEEAGRKMVEEMVKKPEFLDEYRDECEFFDVEVADTVIEEDEDDEE